MKQGKSLSNYLHSQTLTHTNLSGFSDSTPSARRRSHLFSGGWGQNTFKSLQIIGSFKIKQIYITAEQFLCVTLDSSSHDALPYSVNHRCDEELPLLYEEQVRETP